MKYLGTIISALVLCSVVVAEKKGPLSAIAVLEGSDGHVKGNVTFSQNACGESVFVQVYITGLSPGAHGFHIHEKGDLTNGCMSTGGHYNPDKLDHGSPLDEIRHVGDLGNVNAGPDGVVSTTLTDSVINLAGPRSILGRAIVVHTGEDDLGLGNHPDSKKTGNAGGRAACGIIGINEFPDDLDGCNGGVNGLQYSTLLLLCSLIFVTFYHFA